MPDITRFTTLTFTVTRIPNKLIIICFFVNQFFTFTSIFTFVSTLFIITGTFIWTTFALSSFMLFYMSCFISSWHKIKYFHVTLFNGIRNTQFWIWITSIITTTSSLIYLNAVRIKERIININIHHMWSYFTLLIIWNTL